MIQLFIKIQNTYEKAVSNFMTFLFVTGTKVEIPNTHSNLNGKNTLLLKFKEKLKSMEPINSSRKEIPLDAVRDTKENSFSNADFNRWNSLNKSKIIAFNVTEDVSFEGVPGTNLKKVDEILYFNDKETVPNLLDLEKSNDKKTKSVSYYTDKVDSVDGSDDGDDIRLESIEQSDSQQNIVNGTDNSQRKSDTIVTDCDETNASRTKTSAMSKVPLVVSRLRRGLDAYDPKEEIRERRNKARHWTNFGTDGDVRRGGSFNKTNESFKEVKNGPNVESTLSEKEILNKTSEANVNERIKKRIDEIIGGLNEPTEIFSDAQEVVNATNTQFETNITDNFVRNASDIDIKNKVRRKRHTSYVPQDYTNQFMFLATYFNGTQRKYLLH